jgi:hypothetical protein
MIPGKACAMDADLLSSGISKDAVCVEYMVSPFGKQTLKGFWNLTLCWQGSLAHKKCPVHALCTLLLLSKS